LALSDPYFIRRLALFPITARIREDSRDQSLSLAGLDLQELARQYGTPLYLYDQATLDACVRDYREALAETYPGRWGITYAGKAYLCVAVAQWATQRGLMLDCTGAGELAIAAAAGVPPDKILVHGVNKNQTDLQAAIVQAGTLVLDNLSELEKLIYLLDSGRLVSPNLWIRLRPGLAVETHSYTQTGQDDSKFGINPAEIELAVQLCLANGLPLKGIHFHQGSHFHDPAPLGQAIDRSLDLIAELSDKLGWMAENICPGGGWGVPYHEDELPHPPVKQYVKFISERLVDGCRSRGLPLPHLQIEPGRSLVARAGVAVYHLETIKETAHRRWLLLDGGLADNPRPALYRASYSALPVLRPTRPLARAVSLAGPYCESGDVLIENLPMPEMEPGEFIAIPVSGAYQLSMGSNYNGARRPAVLWLSQGEAMLVQRRETLDDLVRRDFPLPDGWIPNP
jgi:diaminopimelate decarboxylase